MAETSAATLRDARIAWGQVLVLFAVSALMLRHELAEIAMSISKEVESAHAFAAPILIGLIVFWRRRLFVSELRRGSVWGLIAIVGALAIYSITTWPFNYSTVRHLSIIPLIAGILLTITGWRVLMRCMPILLILMLAIPIGARYLASLIIVPETMTLEVVAVIFSFLPGINVTLDGLDLTYITDSGLGTIALGEPHRGASLFFASLSIGVFVMFARIRPLWQLVAVGIAAIPIVLFCNLARVLVWGLVTIYGECSPTSSTPRIVATATALILVYCVFAASFAVLSKLLVESDSKSTSSSMDGVA